MPIRYLIFCVWVIGRTKAIGKVSRVVGASVESNRDGGRIDPIQGHGGRGGHSCIYTIHGTGGRSHGSWVVPGEMIVRIDENVPPIPMVLQNLGRIVVALTALSSSTKAKYEDECDRSNDESNKHKDTGDSSFILEKA